MLIIEVSVHVLPHYISPNDAAVNTVTVSVITGINLGKVMKYFTQQSDLSH